jgi:tripartite-type tricarboxylate transporter receptor subunit TctC
LSPSLGRFFLDLPGQYAAARKRRRALARTPGFFYSRRRHLRKCVNLGIDMPRLRDFGLALFLALFFAALATTAGRAQEPYPTRVVKIVLPVAPGSTTDILARLIADQLSQKWGKPVIIDNMPGAAMNIGSEYVARAESDGYTLLLCPPSPLAIQQLLYHDLKYDPTKFVPIALLAKIANVLAVRPDFPAKSVQELIAYAKANPGKLTFASQGVGSTAHLSGSELEVLGGIKMVHVPYHGAQPALTDVMSGNVDMFFDTLTTSVPLYRAGKLKLLGVASAERSKDVPEIPTIAESGIPGFRSITWFAIAGPPGLAAPLADKINRDVAEILRKPEIVAKIQALRLEPMGGTTADAAKFIGDETQLWGRVIKEANITLQ